MPKVLLIDMPFANLLTPSIGLGILKAGLTQIGVESKILNFHLKFAETCGPEPYNLIHSETYAEHLVGEWIFSGALFPERKTDDFQHYFRCVLDANEPDQPDRPFYGKGLLQDLLVKIPLVREKVEEFLAQALEEVLAYDPVVVGFTSVFEQHVASLSLAKLIKENRPDCTIVFGGSNCEGPMGNETLRQFEFVDAVVSGEGDVVFPELVRSVLDSNSIPNLQGIFKRKGSRLPVAGSDPQNTPTLRNLDLLPIPDYDDYFKEIEKSSLKLSRQPILLFETSRGCWWGEKQHCTFCGLNGATMTYRSKSAQRALDELVYLTDRYPGCTVNVVDNILDMKYFKTFLKLLAKRDSKFGLFYEVKSNLRKDQLKLLREAGVTTIQPGIESLSDNVLRIMRKGVTALQNVQLMKWCTELDIGTYYNLIWGFPGESIDDYKDIGSMIPLITHLRPPIGSSVIRIDRFSPNFNESRQLGIGEVAPYPAYHYVYPFKPEVLFNLAYFFEPVEREFNAESDHVKQLSTAIKSWQATYKQSDLFFFEKGPKLLIWDMRPIAKEQLVILDDCSKIAYLACDEAKTPTQVADYFRASSQEVPSDSHLYEILDSFVDRSLMLRDGNRYLSLAYRKAA